MSFGKMLRMLGFIFVHFSFHELRNICLYLYVLFSILRTQLMERYSRQEVTMKDMYVELIQMIMAR